MGECERAPRPARGDANRARAAASAAAAVVGFLIALSAQAAPSASIGDSAAASAPRPKIGLALGGGGARGAAHLGVFRVLEELRIPIDYCAGTSMGAILGALYSCGLSPEEMTEQIGRTDWDAIFHDAPSRRDTSLRRKEEDLLPLFGFELGVERYGIVLPPGIIAGQRLQLLLRSLTLCSIDMEGFDELPIPFRAVACDLSTGEMVVIDHGDLSDAMRASMAIPGAFTPARLEGRLLVDGGIVQNLPVETARAMGAQVVIAVDVGSPLPEIEESRPSFVGVAARALNLLTRGNSRASREALVAGDVLINPGLPGIDIASFGSMLEAAKAGEEAARARIEDLRRYSVSEEEYAAWKSRVRGWAEEHAGRLRIESIEVSGTRRVSPDLIRRRIRTQPREQLDIDVLRDDLDRIARIGEFEMIDFSVTGREGARTLVIRVREKSWGPGYLCPGLGIEGNFDAEADFLATLLYRRAFANRLGGEWRAILGVGDVLSLDSDFDQPLVESGLVFVSPSIHLLDDKGRFRTPEGQPELERIRRAHGQIDLGARVGEALELRAGALRGRIEAEFDSGPETPRLREELGAFEGRILFDRLDEYPLPRAGSRLQADLTLSREGLGADRGYDRLLIALQHAQSVGRNTILLRSIFGTDFDSGLPPYDPHTLGGFLRLSGFEPDALAGDAVTYVALAYYREIDRLAPYLGRGIVAGCAVEAGEVWGRLEAFRPRDLRPAGLIFLGARTILGPVHLGYGQSEGGERAGYLFIGKPFD